MTPNWCQIMAFQPRNPVFLKNDTKLVSNYGLSTQKPGFFEKTGFLNFNQKLNLKLAEHQNFLNNQLPPHIRAFSVFEEYSPVGVDMV
jgi:hypothetical protein